MPKSKTNSTILTLALVGGGGFVLYKAGPVLLKKLKGSSSSASGFTGAGYGSGASSADNGYQYGYEDAMAAQQNSLGSVIGNALKSLFSKSSKNSGSGSSSGGSKSSGSGSGKSSALGYGSDYGGTYIQGAMMGLDQNGNPLPGMDSTNPADYATYEDIPTMPVDVGLGDLYSSMETPAVSGGDTQAPVSSSTPSDGGGDAAGADAFGQNSGYPSDPSADVGTDNSYYDFTGGSDNGNIAAYGYEDGTPDLSYENWA